MGFHKRFVPELDKLIEIHKECVSDNEFIQRVVGKAEALIGSEEPIKYIDEIYEKIMSKNAKSKN